MTSGKHFHIMIWVADGKTEQGYLGVTYVEVIAKSIEEALKRAKELIPNRNHYHVNNVIEHHGHEPS